VLNPLRTAQDVTVSLLGTDIVRTLSVPPRARVAQELGAWGARGNFGVEVRCGSICAASLVMWDADMRTPNPSVPTLGCEER